MLTNEITKRSSKLLLCAAALAIGAVGCAADDAAIEDEGSVEGQALQAPSSQSTVRDPGGAYFADVKANGTGCPAGTWDTQLSADGKTFTTTFSAYETEVDRNSSVDVKDCQLAVKFHSPQGLSFAISEFSYTGYAFLERGVNLAQSANYYFQGNPVVPVTTRTNITGPYDDAFLFKDTIGTSDLVWSPCGVERDLNVTTRLRLRNSNNPRRQGYANLTAVDANTRLVFKIDWRRCRD